MTLFVDAFNIDIVSIMKRTPEGYPSGARILRLCPRLLLGEVIDLFVEFFKGQARLVYTGAQDVSLSRDLINV